MSARRLRSLAADEAGATAVEMAILAPVFFVLTLGIVQLGWALHCGSAVRWALERSARTLVLNPDATEAQVRADVVSRLSNITGGDTVAVTLVREGVAPAQPQARVRAVYGYGLNIPFVPAQTLQFRSEVVVPLPA